MSSKGLEITGTITLKLLISSSSTLDAHSHGCPLTHSDCFTTKTYFNHPASDGKLLTFSTLTYCPTTYIWNSQGPSALCFIYPCQNSLVFMSFTSQLDSIVHHLSYSLNNIHDSLSFWPPFLVGSNCWPSPPLPKLVSTARKIFTNTTILSNFS